MKKALLGALFLVAGALATAPAAQAQHYGQGGYGSYDAGRHSRAWAREAEWQERMERRARREYWRHQRQAMERQAYEAGRRDAYHQHQPVMPWQGGWR